MEEQELLLRAKQGCQDAFGHLVAQYEARVFHQALRMVGSPEDASDVTQEVFFKAWRSLPQFQGNSTFATWLYKLTDHAAIDLLRRERKRRGDVALDHVSLDVPQLSDPTPGPQASLEAKELRDTVAHGLNQLSAEHRQVLVLREINGLSYQQIAQLLHLSVGTVKSRIARARLSLADIVRKSGNLSSSHSSNPIDRR